MSNVKRINTTIDYSVSTGRECLLPSGFRDRVALSVKAGLISEVVDSLGLALGVGVGVAAPDDDHGMRLVLFIEGFLQLAILVARDSIFGLEAENGSLIYIKNMKTLVK